MTSRLPSNSEQAKQFIGRVASLPGLVACQKLTYQAASWHATAAQCSRAQRPRGHSQVVLQAGAVHGMAAGADMQPSCAICQGLAWVLRVVSLGMRVDVRPGGASHPGIATELGVVRQSLGRQAAHVHVGLHSTGELAPSMTVHMGTTLHST